MRRGGRNRDSDSGGGYEESVRTGVSLMGEVSQRQGLQQRQGGSTEVHSKDTYTKQLSTLLMEQNTEYGCYPSAWKFETQIYIPTLYYQPSRVSEAA